jgi:hypothetical protein
MTNSRKMRTLSAIRSQILGRTDLDDKAACDLADAIWVELDVIATPATRGEIAETLRATKTPVDAADALTRRFVVLVTR